MVLSLFYSASVNTKTSTNSSCFWIFVELILTLFCAFSLTCCSLRIPIAGIRATVDLIGSFDQLIKSTMLACKVEPTIFMPTSSLAWSKPKMRLGGTIKSVHIGANDPKCPKSVTYNVRNGILKNWKLRQPDRIHDILSGRMVPGGLVFQQELAVRSFDVGSDSKMSMVALANYLQETSLNHAEKIELLSGGFSTPEMSRRDLVWVFHKMDIAIDRYPSWHDVIQIHTWMYESGKNGLGIDWIFSDLKTGNTFILASSLLAMMNKKTRKLSKFVREARKELKPYLMPNYSPMIENRRKLEEVDIDTADSTRLDLSPGWNDLDMNHHVNNVKYIDWILEGAPSSIMGSHQLCFINLEFRKECTMDATLKSLSRYVSSSSEYDHSTYYDNEDLIELKHSLRLDGGPEVARARTIWNLKHPNQLGSFNIIDGKKKALLEKKYVEREQ